jgi:hypothetical protein
VLQPVLLLLLLCCPVPVCSKDQVEVATDITNAMLPEVLKVARPEWSKVRWINVQGLSWDVITTLAVAFDLHPLVRGVHCQSLW